MMRMVKSLVYLLSLVYFSAFSFAMGANERFVVISQSNTYEGILFFASATLLFLVLFVFIHWGVRRY